jgi:hypothetical protein
MIEGRNSVFTPGTVDEIARPSLCVVQTGTGSAFTILPRSTSLAAFSSLPTSTMHKLARVVITIAGGLGGQLLYLGIGGAIQETPNPQHQHRVLDVEVSVSLNSVTMNLPDQPGQRAVHNLAWARLGLSDVRGHVRIDVTGIYGCDMSSPRSQLYADGVRKHFLRCFRRTIGRHEGGCEPARNRQHVYNCAAAIFRQDRGEPLDHREYPEIVCFHFLARRPFLSRDCCPLPMPRNLEFSSH